MKSKEKELKHLEQTMAEQLQLQMQVPRFALEDGATVAPPPPLSATPPMAPFNRNNLPRTPSGGSLPGPRQRAQSPLEDAGSSNMPLRTQPKKLGSVKDAPGGPTTEDSKRMESLLLTADLNSQQIQMQSEENKLLREQIEQLLQERQERPGTAGSSGSTGRVRVTHEKQAPARAGRSGRSRSQTTTVGNLATTDQSAAISQ